MSPRPSIPTPSECPVCGEGIPRGAKACPSCGADERSGWNEEETRYDGLDLPPGAFDDENPRRPKTARQVSGIPVFWWVIGVVALVAAIASALGLLR